MERDTRALRLLLASEADGVCHVRPESLPATSARSYSIPSAPPESWRTLMIGWSLLIYLVAFVSVFVWGR